MNLFDVVKNECDIVKVYEDYTNYSISQIDAEIKVRCPLPGHIDETPSACINPVEGLYYCFTCKKGGSVIDLVKDINGIKPLAAAQELAKRYHINVDGNGQLREKKKIFNPGF